MFDNSDEDQDYVTQDRILQTRQPILKLKHWDREPLLLISSGDSYFRLWKLENRTGDLQYLKTWQKAHRGPLGKMALNHNILYTISNRDDVMKSWDLQAQEKGLIYEGHTRPLTYLTLDENAMNTIYTSSFDGHIKLWDIRNSTSQSDIHASNDCITKIKVIPNYLISSSSDGTLRVWDRRKTSDTILRGHTSHVFGYYTKNKKIYSYSNDGNILIWKLKTGEMKLRIDVGYPILYTRMYKKYLLVYGSNSSIELFTTKGKKLNTFNGHTEEITSAIFYDSDYFFSSSADRTVRIFNYKRGVCSNVYRGHTDTVNSIVTWGRWVYSGSSDGSIRQWPNVVFRGNLHNNEELV